MNRIALKYGNGEITLELGSCEPDVYVPKELAGVGDVSAAVAESLAQPIGSPPLRDLARPGMTAALVVDDATRAVPNARMLPPIVDELTSGGIRLEDILVVVATGLHRPLRDEELARTLGPLHGRIRIINHQPESDLQHLGRTGLGTDVWLNRRFLAADLKVLIGDVEYHQFCGFGGGAKSVFPGLADAESIRLSHSRMELRGTGPGRIEGNPVRQEIEEVGRMAKVDFIVNAVLNSGKEVVGVFAGHLKQAFAAGVSVCEQMYAVQAPSRYDVVLASAGGFPKDIELYQSQKALSSAVRAVRRGGRIVLFAECREGHGSETSYQWMKKAARIEDIFDRIREGFVMGGHKAYQFAKAVEWAEVHLYSTLDSELVTTYFMRPLASPGAVRELIGKGERVAVLPQAPLTLVRVHHEEAGQDGE